MSTRKKERAFISCLKFGKINTILRFDQNADAP